MKTNITLFVFFIIFLFNCSEEDTLQSGQYEFVSEYATMVTVGGVVGITERLFEIGEIYHGVDTGKGAIKIKIADHSILNDNCPNSWCYQEYLDVPVEFLKFIN